METLRYLFTDGAKLLPLLGLSIVGLVTVIRQVVLWIRKDVSKRVDRRRLGEQYKTWQRLAEQSRPGGFPRSLTRTIDSVKGDLYRITVDALKREISLRLDRSASGTIDLTYKDLLTAPGLIIPIRYVDAEGNLVAQLTQDDHPSFSPIPNKQPRQGDYGIIVVGPAGAGKSMLCRSIEYRWASGSETNTWIVTIDPTDFLAGRAVVNPGDIGSKDWLTSVLMRRLFEDPLSPFERRAFSDLIEKYVRIIVDGIDEIAELLSPSEMERFLKSWIRSRADVSTVRTSYFESVISGDPIARRFHVAFCEEAQEAQLQQYILDLCERIYPSREAKARATAAQELRQRAPDLRALTHNPLLLTMCVSLRGLDPAVGRLDVSTVYREFVRQSLSRDRKAGRTDLTVDVVIEVLCEFAWIRFRQLGNIAAGESSLLAAVSSVSDIQQSARRTAAEAMESCPLLALEHSLAISPDEFDAKFYHKSFEDYFVARRVEDWLFGRSQRGEDFFDHIDTPEVTFFIKEAVIRLAENAPARKLAAERLHQALLAKIQVRKESTDERVGRTLNFAAGQIAYYLGMIGGPEVQHSLGDILDKESDFWVKRCGVIGLAFGEAPKMFHSFIDEMREEMASGDFTNARKNIGIELGFYGDQTFDPLDPVRDAGDDSCKHIIGRSLLELRLDIEAANWRMVLFNLLYLAKYRSPECFAQEIKERKEELRQILQVMVDDPQRATYPEVNELLEILDSGK